MDKFLGTSNLSKPHNEKIESLNRPITSKKIVSVFKNLSTNRNPELDRYTGEI